MKAKFEAALEVARARVIERGIYIDNRSWSESVLREMFVIVFEMFESLPVKPIDDGCGYDLAPIDDDDEKPP